MTRPGLSLFALLITVSSLAQTPTWTLDGPPFSAAPAAILSAAAAIPAQPFAEATVLFEQETYTLTPDNRVTHRHQLLYRIETKEGIDNWSRVSVDWDPWYQSQPTIKARVLQPGGRVSDLDPKTLTDVPAKNEQDDTFSDARIHKGPLPSIAVGSIVEEDTVVTDKLPFFAAGSAYRIAFTRDVPVLRTRLVVETPVAMPFQARTVLIPDSAIHTTTDAGLRRTVYELSNLPITLDSDIDLYHAQIVTPRVTFATGASWAAIASAYAALSDPQIQPAATKPILPPTPSADYLANIQTIVSRLHKEVRYTGIEFGESALKPETPAEVLKRHYGDCKDKAAFLVAMLRASGIPANLALLQTGPGSDVNPDQPGMNQFDHAIVHVPSGGPGKPELWIDATAEFTRVGDLPYMDQGRQALIIAPETTTLTQIPQAKSTDSVLVETREVTLAPYGPAHIVESSATTGHIDADYRSRYGAAESKALHEELEKYSRNHYNAKALTKIEHTEGSDLNKPFMLRLDMAKAARGFTSSTDAAVGVGVSGVMSDLPGWFFDDPAATKLTPEQEADRLKAVQMRATTYQVRPFIKEWRYRITLPDGFTPRALPEDQTQQLGPATLTRHFAAEPKDNPTLVTASFRFDTGKPTYTVDEALALRKAVLELDRQDYLMLQFDQVGARLFTEGKIRQALAADRALIAAHPADSIHHVRLSAVLMDAGLGDQSQAEARLATSLDPKSAIAFYQLGQALEHNSIGVDLGKGFDRKGALEAYRKAAELDPENTDYIVQLALMNENDTHGDRYAPGADLATAIRLYRSITAIDKPTALRYEDNILYDLLYSRQYAELLAEIKPLPSSQTREAITITALAASSTIKAALARAELTPGDTTQKSAALRLSGIQLMRLGLYPQCADILTAAAHGQSDSAAVSQQAALFRTLKRLPPDPVTSKPTDPRYPVEYMFASTMDGTIGQKIATILDPHIFVSDAERKRNLEQNNSLDILTTISRQSQLPPAVIRDLVIGQSKVSSEGSDDHGYRITSQTVGSAPQSFFVSRDEGKYWIVADSSDNAEVGNYALYLLAQHREPEASALLDWKRDAVHRGGGDDPLDGPLFPRFWTAGNTDPDQIRIAALALTLSKPNTQAPLAPALAASAKLPEDPDLNLLLASVYLNQQNPTAARPYFDKLVARYPDSITAIALAGQDYQASHDYTAWSAMLKARLAKRPNDPGLLRQQALLADAQADFAQARKSLQQIIDSGKANDADYNNIAWQTLFDNQVDAKAIDNAQQSITLSKGSFSDLHTLACLYAAQGKTTEAREILLRAMATANLAEPNSPTWFAFGLIYEQFGDTEAAIAAYKKVTPPETQPINPTDTWILAQSHLKALHAS